MSDINTKRTVEDGVLIVTAYREERFHGFDGEEVEAPIKVAEFRLPADDEELVRQIGHSLLAHYAEKQPTGPTGQKPMHQQYAEQEPPR